MKETLNKVKIQPSEWEKIIVNDIIDEELISKLYKQFMQLNTSEMNNPIKKRARRTKQTFLQRRHTNLINKRKVAQHDLLSEKCK